MDIVYCLHTIRGVKTVIVIIVVIKLFVRSVYSGFLKKIKNNLAFTENALNETRSPRVASVNPD